VRAPARYQVLSNMPELRVDTDGDARVHRFAPTPPLPTYLVSVSVGRFHRLEGRAAGVPLSIYTVPGKRELARYAMRASEQVVSYYSQYFGTPYALPKLDQLAVPGVRSGAMEDWGLISYTDSALLFDPARSSSETRRIVYSSVAHEIAHQWFGNLVTAASWDEIWLNEAFATWMANKTTHHFNPRWQWELGKRPWFDMTMARDATPATRAIRAGPVRESSVFDVFDNITPTPRVARCCRCWSSGSVPRRSAAAWPTTCAHGRCRTRPPAICGTTSARPRAAKSPRSPRAGPTRRVFRW
jgi:aminopeptidase N